MEINSPSQTQTHAPPAAVKMSFKKEEEEEEETMTFS
jgi:hypothetical protein